MTWLPPSPRRPQQAGKGRTQEAGDGGRESRRRVLDHGEVRRAHDVIVGLTDAFCREHLNDEYAALCRKLAASWPASGLPR